MDLRIRLASIPHLDINAAYQLANSVDQVGGYAERFAAALSLFDFSTAELSEALPRFGQASAMTQIKMATAWARIAARDGAITIYNFRSSLDNVTSCLHLVPCVKQRTCRETLRMLKRRFDAHFPHWERMRHGISHEADFAGARDEHAFSGSYEQHGIKLNTGRQKVILTDTVSGRTFITTVKKQIVTYEISNASLEMLKTTYNELNSHLIDSCAAP